MAEKKKEDEKREEAAQQNRMAYMRYSSSLVFSRPDIARLRHAHNHYQWTLY